MQPWDFHSRKIYSTYSNSSRRVLHFCFYFSFSIFYTNIARITQHHWSCCCILTFRILHFELYNILKCKKFLIGFLDELGNFKQKKFYTSKCTDFLHFTATGPIAVMLVCLILGKEFSHSIKLNAIFVYTEAILFGFSWKLLYKTLSKQKNVKWLFTSFRLLF